MIGAIMLWTAGIPIRPSCIAPASSFERERQSITALRVSVDEKSENFSYSVTVQLNWVPDESERQLSGRCRGSIPHHALGGSDLDLHDFDRTDRFARTVSIKSAPLQ